MTDERLSEIENRLKTIQRIDWTSNEYKPANAMYMTKAKQDIKYLISSLRAEKAKVAELNGTLRLIGDICCNDCSKFINDIVDKSLGR